MMTSGGNRNPVNDDTGADPMQLLADLIDQACPDQAIDERNRAGTSIVEPSPTGEAAGAAVPTGPRETASPSTPLTDTTLRLCS
jgi:hypothetical protein